MHAYFMLFYKFLASKNFPPKSLMPRMTSNLLAIKHPINLFPRHGTSPGNVFVHAASSFGNLKFLEDNLLAPTSGVRNPKRSPETSVRNYYYSLRNNPDESSSHLLRSGSLKSRLKFCFPMHINLTLCLKSSQLLKICLLRSNLHKLFSKTSQRDGLSCTVSSSVLRIMVLEII
jgi:hypothetical protein